MQDVINKNGDQKKKNKIVTKNNVTLWDVFSRVDAVYRMMKTMNLCDKKESGDTRKDFPFVMPAETEEDVAGLELFIKDPDNYQSLVRIYVIF